MKKLYIGSEQLQVGGHGIAVTMNDFWRWAGSNLSDAATRSVFAEFLVASSLDILSDGRQVGRSYDLLWPQRDGKDIRVNVSSAAYVQSADAEHPDQVSFPLGAKDHFDVCVFCLFKAMAQDQAPLDTELWDFYTISASLLNGVWDERQSLTMDTIMRLEPVWSDYYGIGDAILAAWPHNRTTGG